MADFNKVLTPGDYEKGELNVKILHFGVFYTIAKWRFCRFLEKYEKIHCCNT